MATLAKIQQLLRSMNLIDYRFLLQKQKMLHAKNHVMGKDLLLVAEDQEATPINGVMAVLSLEIQHSAVEKIS